jgi:hypothetical protein
MERILKRCHIRMYIMPEVVLWSTVTDTVSYVRKMNSISKGKRKVVPMLN